METFPSVKTITERLALSQILRIWPALRLELTQKKWYVFTSVQVAIAYPSAITTTLSRNRQKSKNSTPIYIPKWLKITKNLICRSQMLDFQYSYSNVIAKGEMRWQWFCISRETCCNGQPLVKHWILTLVLRTRVKIQCITRGLTRETLDFCTRASHLCKNLMYHS